MSMIIMEYCQFHSFIYSNLIKKNFWLSLFYPSFILVSFLVSSMYELSYIGGGLGEIRLY